MVDARRAIVFSATLTVLLSVPVASQQVRIQQKDGGFNAVVSTDYTTNYRLNTSTGKRSMELVDSRSRYSYTQRPSVKREKFVTSKGLLRKRRTANESLTILKTPYGTLKTGYRDGENVSKFTGPEGMRSRVLKIRRKLMKRMNVSHRESVARKRSVMDRVLPDVEMSSDYQLDTINLTNAGNSTVSLKGWRIVKSGKTEEPYPVELETVLGPGENMSMDVGVDSNDGLVLENEAGRRIDSSG
ncbi:MAG: hypothetical protein ABEJ87_00400 [Candidatus Nanohalobium sp.]